MVWYVCFNFLLCSFHLCLVLYILVFWSRLVALLQLLVSFSLLAGAVIHWVFVCVLRKADEPVYVQCFSLTINFSIPFRFFFVNFFIIWFAKILFFISTSLHFPSLSLPLFSSPLSWIYLHQILLTGIWLELSFTSICVRFNRKRFLSFHFFNVSCEQ